MGITSVREKPHNFHEVDTGFHSVRAMNFKDIVMLLALDQCHTIEVVSLAQRLDGVADLMKLVSSSMDIG